jgi:serine/threonine protein kinase/Flp pilus assembly protein TadD
MSDASVGEAQSVESLVARVADEFRERQSRGERPDPEEYATRYPEAAPLLRKVLAALDVLGLSLASGAAVGTDSPGAPLNGVLGDFRLIREVGRGGMGIVYEAEQISLRRRVALKALPFAATMDPRHLQRFHNEAQAAAGLHHTNIVPVHFVGSERGAHYYAMQYIEGRDLGSVIAQLRAQPRGARPGPQTDETKAADDGPATSAAATGAADTPPIAGLSTEGSAHSREYFRTVARLAIQAAEALDHAHQMGIVHRDVKPANLIVDATSRLWVTDFGLAQMQSDTRLTMTGDLVGTLRYMSPEQALAQRVIVDHRSDIYSLAATLYELLTLQPVFNGRDRQELLRQIAFDDPRPPRRIGPAIPDELETIVLKALEKNPAERYATAQALADDLRRFLEDKPIHARRPSVLRRARKWARRHRAGVTAAASVVLLPCTILAASVGWLARDHEGRRTETERAVIAALDESTARQEQRRLPEALSAARRAVGVADGGTADDVLRRRIRQRVADLELVERLENIRIDKMTAVRDGHFDSEGADAEYGQAFREAGLDIESLPIEATERLGRSTVAIELAAVLDHWALVRRQSKGQGDSSWKALLRMARLADADAWRTRVRHAMEQEDSAELRELVASEEVFGLPVATLDVLGSFFREDKDARLAEAFLREAQRRHPNDFWLNEHLYLYLSCMQCSQLEERLRFATVAVALRPRSPGARYNLGAALAENGRLDDAIAEFRQAIAIDPKYAEAHNNLGFAPQKMGRLDDAIAEYRKALASDPKNAKAHINLGNLLRDTGRLDEAIAVYKHRLDIDPKDAHAHNNLGLALQDKGRLDDAIAEYELALDIEPNDAIAHSNLGNALREKGRLDDAVAEYKQAIAIDPQFAMAHHNLGVALQYKGRLDDAIAEYKQAIALDPKHARAHNNLGTILQAKGRLDLEQA